LVALIETRHGTREQQQAVLEKCKLARPVHGQLRQENAEEPKTVGIAVDQVLQDRYHC
jgi:hypothetical protein